MAGIRVVNALEVETDIGKCFIHLCIGDITALPKRDEVDVLVLSAFPGDYSPSPTSLIGQLLRKLGISVKHLAKDKEEDLRTLYSCWWSKPLAEHLSFKRILCFEGGRSNRSVGQVVGDVFRCLVPILANNEGKVIMPILASGDQRKSKTKMLKLLMDAAIHWMKAGLPLRSLKIVIFSRNIDNISKADQPLFDLFQKLKTNHEQEEKQDKEVEVNSEKYDIYLSYSEEDVNFVDQVVGVLEKKKTNIRVFSSIQKLDLETSWQTQLYEVIKNCKRVMALITPSFLQSERCTEQYNIALCHSRKTHESVLMPLYVTDVQYMPTYMRITQYIDCRISFQEKLNAACVTVIGSFSCEVLEIATKNKKDTPASPKPSAQTYDVFLSYSHCNSEYARQIVKELRHKKPDLNIFIDTTELKAGGAWQLTLYNALDCSKFFIALVSNDYLHSKVCNEEICLSIALQLQNNCKIWPLIIEPLQKNIEWLNVLSPVNLHNNNLEEDNNSISFICNQFLAAIKDNSGNESLSGDIVQTSLQSCLEEARPLFFEKDFVSLVADTSANSTSTQNNELNSSLLPKDSEFNVDIYIICSSEDEESCSLLQNIIMMRDESFVVKTSTSESASTRLTYLDKARLIIPLLSGSLIQSAELVHELNIAWCRQRDCSSLCFLAIVLEELPKNPTYVSLFPCFFNCADDVWTKGRETLKLYSSDELTRVYRDCQCPLNVVLCFMSVVDHIQRWQDGEHCPVLGTHNKLFNCLQLNECIQGHKETLSKHVDKEENGAVVSPCAGSSGVSDDAIQKSEEVVCARNDDGNSKLEHAKQREVKSHDPVQESEDKKENKQNENGVVHLQNSENDNVEQNEDQNPSQVTEERGTILQSADTKEPKGDGNNALHGSQDVHQNIHDEKEATDKNEEQPMSSKNKSSTCSII